MFGAKSVGLITDHVKGLLDAQRNEIDRSLLLCDKSLKVTISVTITPKDGSNDIKTKIKFIKESISDEFQETIEDNASSTLSVAK